MTVDPTESARSEDPSSGNVSGPADEAVSRAGAGERLDEAEMMAAYEEELNRITSSEMILQTAVSLLNIAGRRLGMGSPSTPGSAPDRPGQPAEGGSASDGVRDLEQVCDAIDGVRALMPILERHMPAPQLGPLRQALSQLQMAYAREVGKAAPVSAPAAGASAAPAGAKPQPTPADGVPRSPGPAEASGRLWVPGR